RIVEGGGRDRHGLERTAGSLGYVASHSRRPGRIDRRRTRPRACHARPGDRPRHGGRRLNRKVTVRAALGLAGLVALVIVVNLLTGGSFATPTNITNVLRQITYNTILAV